jgi:hypothetical protein
MRAVMAILGQVWMQGTDGRRTIPATGRHHDAPLPAIIPERPLPRHMNNTTEFEAAAFRRLLSHLDQRKDVQNIDLMILAGFCRNCLADWYREAAEAAGAAMSKEQAREHVYGMPFVEWKAQFQPEATPEQLAAFAAAQKAHP